MVKQKYSYKNITVLKDGIIVGELNFGDGKYYFKYATSYKGKELIGLTNNDETHESCELFYIFENLIPKSHRQEKHIDIEESILEDKSKYDYSSLSGYQNKIDVNIDETSQTVFYDERIIAFKKYGYLDDLEI